MDEHVARAASIHVTRSTTSGPDAAPMPEVHEKIERLDASVSYLDDRLAALLNRLGPVMGDEMPQPAPDTVPETIIRTHVGHRLHDIGSRVQNLTAVIDVTIGRLEV
jgi:hypothetical protein